MEHYTGTLHSREEILGRREADEEGEREGMNLEREEGGRERRGECREMVGRR